MEEVTVLQVGMKNLSKVYIIPRNVRWVYIQSGQLTKEKLKSLEVKKITAMNTNNGEKRLE